MSLSNMRLQLLIVTISTARAQVVTFSPTRLPTSRPTSIPTTIPSNIPTWTPTSAIPSSSPTNCYGIEEPTWCSLDVFNCDYSPIRKICPKKCNGGCAPTSAPTSPTSAPTVSPTMCLADVNTTVCGSLFTRSNNGSATAATDECCTRPQIARFCPTTCCGFQDSCAPTSSPTTSPTTSPPTEAPASSEPTSSPTDLCNVNTPDVGFCDGSDLVGTGLSVYEVCVISASPQYPQMNSSLPPYSIICAQTCCRASEAPTQAPTASPTCSSDVFPQYCDVDQCCNPLWGESVRRNCPRTCCGLTCSPTSSPSSSPSVSPSVSPTRFPSVLPTSHPSTSPTDAPTLGCQPDGVPDVLRSYLEPCVDSCCAPDRYVRLLAGQFCQTSCCNVTCAPTSSPTLSPTKVPTTSTPTLRPTMVPSQFPTYTPDDPLADCRVELCCETEPLIRALYTLECRDTCGGIRCDATAPPSASPTIEPHIVAQLPSNVIGGDCTTLLPVYAVDYADERALGLESGSTIELNVQSLPGMWRTAGVFEGLSITVNQTDVRLMIISECIPLTLLEGQSVFWRSNVNYVHPVDSTVTSSTSHPSGRPTISPSTSPSVYLTTSRPSRRPTFSPSTSQSGHLLEYCLSFACGRTCKGECGWDSDVNRCLPGMYTSRREESRGWGCTGARNDQCNLYTCGAECSLHSNCGWSKKKGRCVTGGHTQQSELGHGYCAAPQLATTTTTTAEPDMETVAPLVERECRDIGCARECIGRCGWSTTRMKCKEGGFTSSLEYIMNYGEC